MKNKFSVKIIILSLVALFFNSCSSPEDIAGKFEGAWKSEWDDILSGNVDDITVVEIIIFGNNENSKVEGVFSQFFSGNVKYDDWENETEIPYSLAIAGTWSLKGRNEIILRYNLNSLETEFGNSDISTGSDEAVLNFLKGDWTGLIYDGLKRDSENKKVNKKIDSEVSKQVSNFFKEMFLTMNKDKEAMTDIVIDDDLMTCEINHGFFGRDATYYKIEVTE